DQPHREKSRGRLGGLAIPVSPGRSRRLAVAAGQRLPPPPEGAVLQALPEAESADGESAALLLSGGPPPELLPEGSRLPAAAPGHAGVSSIPMDRLEAIVTWPSRWGS